MNIRDSAADSGLTSSLTSLMEIGEVNEPRASEVISTKLLTAFPDIENPRGELRSLLRWSDGYVQTFGIDNNLETVRQNARAIAYHALSRAV